MYNEIWGYKFEQVHGKKNSNRQTIKKDIHTMVNKQRLKKTCITATCKTGDYCTCIILHL